MALIRFLIRILILIGVLASSSAAVLTVILILRFPLILIIVGIALMVFQRVLSRFPSFE